MYRRLLFVVGLLLVAAARGVAAAPSAMPPGQWMMNTPAPTGRWITASHNAVVQFSLCGADLCGRIVGIVLAPGENVPTDWQGRSQCGLTIIQTAPDAGSNGTSWTGSITDPRDGSIYHAHITLGAAGQLKLRGYLGLPIFGQTQTWTAFAGRPGPNCRLTMP